MEKGKTYHELLTSYIQGIGCTECPARFDEASDFSTAIREDEARAVGQVVERNGVWEIHLITFDPRCPCRLERKVLRTFRSRKMAEIVARYTAKISTDPNGATGREANNICWN